MYIPNCPEDSVLSRHFEAAVEMKRQMWLQMPPSDSVLRRHAMSVGSHPTSRAAAPAPARATRAATTPTRAAAPVKKGFIAWLRDLFA